MWQLHSLACRRYKHYDCRTGHVEVRRARRLVISSISTFMNYEYLSYWHLYQVGGSACNCVVVRSPLCLSVQAFVALLSVSSAQKSGHRVFQYMTFMLHCSGVELGHICIF